MFRHPSYYKKLRERNKSDRVISERQATASSMRAPGLGLEVQIIYQDLSGHKRQAHGSLTLKKVSRTFDRGALPR